MDCFRVHYLCPQLNLFSSTPTPAIIKATTRACKICSRNITIKAWRCWLFLQTRYVYYLESPGECYSMTYAAPLPSHHQFGFQEPDPVEKVRKDMKDRFGVTFPIYNKVDVNGAGAHPLFAALKKYEPELSNHNPKLSWNFTVSCC